MAHFDRNSREKDRRSAITHRIPRKIVNTYCARKRGDDRFAFEVLAVDIAYVKASLPFICVINL